MINLRKKLTDFYDPWRSEGRETFAHVTSKASDIIFAISAISQFILEGIVSNHATVGTVMLIII